MQKLEIDALTPGMVTAEDVYNYNDQLILPKGLVLTQKAISKLHFYDVFQVRVEDEIVPVEPPPEETPAPAAPAQKPAPAAAPAPSAPASADTPTPAASVPVTAAPAAAPAETPRPLPENYENMSYTEKVKVSEHFQVFKKSFDEEVHNYKLRINQVVLKNAPLDVDLLLEDALKVISAGKTSYDIFDMLHVMRENDDVTYSHCMNVGLFCNVFAGWLGMSEKNKRLATLCGLLHDTGKLMIPDKLIKKPSRLSEDEYASVKNHSLEGYHFLKDMDIDIHIKNTALMHHERCDGSGYPFGLTSEKIDPYAKMVAIVDVYDAMTSERRYRSAMSPFQAIDVMREEGLQKYDTRFIMTFLENVMDTFIGNRVLLSNGQEGEIVFIHKTDITRPTIKCGNEFVDLSKDFSIEIVKLL